MMRERNTIAFQHNPTGLKVEHRVYDNVTAVVTHYFEKTNEVRYVYFQWSNPELRRYTPHIWPEWRFHRHFLTDALTVL